MKKLLCILLTLTMLLAPGAAALADDAAILSSPTDVRDLLRDAQAARLPSPNVVTQDLGAAVVEPADASASAWFSAVGDGAAFARVTGPLDWRTLFE